MSDGQNGSQVASFGLSFAIAAISIATIDAIEAFVPSFSESLEGIFGAPWLHLGLLGLLIFFALGLSGIGKGMDWRRTAVLVSGGMILGGLWIFSSTLILAMRGGM